nr:ATP-binding protein [Corynebacterium marquesiae]
MRSQDTDTRAVEVKAAAGGFPKKLVRSISAFANGTGGIIILGLDEDNGFVTVPDFDATAMADALAGACPGWRMRRPRDPVGSRPDRHC